MAMAEKSTRSRPPTGRQPHRTSISSVDGPSGGRALPVIDIVPVAAESRPTRRVSTLERAVALLSRPFGLAILLGLAVFGRGRPHRLMRLLVVLILVSACRARPIWSGAEFQKDGTFKLSSEEPYCGCLTVTNVLGRELHLQSMYHLNAVGKTTLRPGQQVTFRFDWTGPLNADFYELVGSTADGTPVNLQSALRLDERSGWQDCTSIPCEDGDLQMNLGQRGK